MLNFTTKNVHFELSSGTCMVLTFLTAALLRWCISYHPYSGQSKPPLYGDYEAQRHWQEITISLNIKDWYINSTQNDLEYWGLDYPPLTAYHSLLLGYVAHTINPNYVTLYKSRGYESENHKYFMRLSVLVVDFVIYIPAMVYFVYSIPLPKSKLKINSNVFGFETRNALLATALLYPGLILIDHGHFQYNCISLGFFIAAVAALSNNSLILGSTLFVLALNYKQMELYHALPCFFYILGITFNKKKSIFSCLRKLSSVSFTVILTMILIWIPFAENRITLVNVILRLFPLARGIFEDKVANVWCAVNVMYKLREHFSNIQLAQICLLSTTVALLPSCLDLCFRPSREKFLISLINSSLAFFLFSFQVHEKSILLVASPVILYFHHNPLPCFWFLMISTFSMLPLLIKDQLFLAYFTMRICYSYFVQGLWFTTDLSICSTSEEIPKNIESTNLFPRLKIYANNKMFVKRSFQASMLGMDILSVISICSKPPSRYPDLYALLISIYSCAHFFLFFIYFNYKQIFTMQQHRKLKVW